ncbi:hypothetical protein F5141DRAFT_1067932 [Pisolithus sp. B1]|nr:hypothetical protein F5141DRAFT_1067932 [Pisolithus sp. B1]
MTILRGLELQLAHAQLKKSRPSLSSSSLPKELKIVLTYGTLYIYYHYWTTVLAHSGGGEMQGICCREKHNWLHEDHDVGITETILITTQLIARIMGSMFLTSTCVKELRITSIAIVGMLVLAGATLVYGMQGAMMYHCPVGYIMRALLWGAMVVVSTALMVDSYNLIAIHTYEQVQHVKQDVITMYQKKELQAISIVSNLHYLCNHHGALMDIRRCERQSDWRGKEVKCIKGGKFTCGCKILKKKGKEKKGHTITRLKEWLETV